MNKYKENILTCLICLTIGFLGGVMICEIKTRNRMEYQSLEGYRAFAIYETNSVGEVKIKKIEWKKP